MMTFDVPEACTLPADDHPLRVAEFDAVFATALRSVTLLSPTHARVRLDPASSSEARVRDLTARESECCSFFQFTLSSSSSLSDDLQLDIVVPPEHADLLASLVARAEPEIVGSVASPAGRAES